MATMLQLDDRLVVKALQLGRHPTKEAAVTQALVEYIRHQEQLAILNLFGAIDYDPEYDYKTQRQQA